MSDLTPTETIKLDSEPVTMSFPDAIRKIMEGKSVTRISWGGTDHCLLKDDWLSIYTKGAFHTWSINDGDLFGEDWIVV